MYRVLYICKVVILCWLNELNFFFFFLVNGNEIINIVLQIDFHFTIYLHLLLLYVFVTHLHITEREAISFLTAAQYSAM